MVFLREFNVHTVIMESSGPYGLMVYYFLESEGFDVWMVLAQDSKSRGGKKTDIEDAKRLARTLLLARLEPISFPQILRLGH